MQISPEKCQQQRLGFRLQDLSLFVFVCVCVCPLVHVVAHPCIPLRLSEILVLGPRFMSVSSVCGCEVNLVTWGAAAPRPGGALIKAITEACQQPVIGLRLNKPKCPTMTECSTDKSRLWGSPSPSLLSPFLLHISHSLTHPLTPSLTLLSLLPHCTLSSLSLSIQCKSVQFKWLYWH